CEPDVSVVKIVRRADADVVDAIGRAAATQLLEMTVEAFEFGEESDIEAEPVEHADRVVWINRGDKAVTRIPDGLKMPRRDVTRGAGQRKIPRSLRCAHRAPRLLARPASAASLRTAATRGPLTVTE